MKKLKCMLVGLVIFFMIVSTIAILTLATTEETNAGSWEVVCCGKSCVGGDYCLRTGKYTCCKDEPET